MSTFRTNAFAQLQKLGQSLMLPVSVLPAAGLLVALGRALQGAKGNVIITGVGDLCYSGGISIFEQMPTLFAVGVAIGYSSGAAIAGLAAVAGYFTLINVLKTTTTLMGLKLAINTGVFGGIMVGLMSAALYKKFHDTKLPQFLGFFSGKRLVPIVTAASAVVLGLVLSLVWPPIQQGINDFGVAIMGSDLGPSFFSAVKRALIPVGLHHVFYPPFLYQFGEFVTSTGEIVRGEASRYYAGDPSAGIFMGGEYPMMIFGLPATCLAMYLRAKKERRKQIAGVMTAAALTAIITGITEPIEFSFIFVAPILFIAHIVLSFFAALATSMMDVHLGYTFSASVIDLIMGAFNAHNMSKMLFITGPLTALAYFGVFYWLIGLLDLKTPGREDAVEEDTSAGPVSKSDKAVKVLAALGGKDNIKTIDACITRLRLSVKDFGAVNVAAFKPLGATGHVHAGGGNLQVIFGVESDMLKEEIKKVMASAPSANVITSPIEGTILDLSKVPDEMFSQKMMGEGIAIDPTNGKVYAPCSGTIGTIFKTNHAVAIAADNGAELLIHVGIDTVKMNGDGFKGHVKNGDVVKKGQLLIEFDLEKVKKHAKSHITPVVVTNSADLGGVSILKSNGKADLNSALLEIRK